MDSFTRLTPWLSFVVSYCEFVTFPLVSWVRVSIPDLCTLTYFRNTFKIQKNEVRDKSITTDSVVKWLVRLTHIPVADGSIPT